MIEFIEGISTGILISIVLIPIFLKWYISNKLDNIAGDIFK
jgi:hypothetical protein